MIDRKTNKLLLFALKTIVALLVLSVLIRRIQLEQLHKALQSADLRLIVAAALLLSLNLYWQFAKWRVVIHQENPTIRAGRILYSLLVGMALGLATPGRVGDFGRTFFVKDADWARLLGLLMIDKLIALCVLYLVGILGLSHFISMKMHSFVWLPVLIMVVTLALGVLLIVLRPNLLRSLVGRYRHVSHRIAALERLVSGVELATPAFTFQLLRLTVLQTITYCTQFVLLTFSFTRINVMAAYYSVFSIMFAKSLLPISIGDLGIRESASVYFFGQSGVPEAAAFNASLLLFVINVLTPSLVGVGLFLFKRLNMKKAYAESASS